MEEEKGEQRLQDRGQEARLYCSNLHEDASVDTSDTAPDLNIPDTFLSLTKTIQLAMAGDA